MDERDWLNGDTLDYADRPVGRIPRQYVPEDALTTVPPMRRAGRITEKARGRTIPAQRLGGRERNTGSNWPPS